jgi:phage terminase Nu1 subunit (DNA packaging protein)|tara:strand:+ start:18 stop:212 length:195 start_codon:yes stop_codon:yes gene_type:complete
MKDRNFIDQGQLAERWKRSERTLENWRSRGIGIPYYKIGGKVLYDFADVTAYESEQLQQPINKE